MNLRRFSLTSAAFCLLAGAGVVTAQSLPSETSRRNRARDCRTCNARTPTSRRNGCSISSCAAATAPTDELGGPLAFAAYNVPVANALLDLHDGAVGKGTLDAHVRELAILVACRATNYDFEWNAHEAAALRAGVEQKVVDVVRTNGALTGVPDADAAVIRFGRELLNDRKMSSATFAKAKQLFGDEGRDGPRRRHEHLRRQRLLRHRRRRARRRRSADPAGGRGPREDGLRSGSCRAVTPLRDGPFGTAVNTSL